MTGRPLIGVMLDHAESGSFSSRPHHAIRVHYFEAVWRSGGLPVGMPYLDEAIPEYLARLDGLLTPGGRYPFPAAWYGRPADPGETITPRARFEIDLTRAALDRDMPILGICAGMQVLAGVMGGTFYADVRVELETAIDHLDERPAEEFAHPVRVAPGSALQRITGRSAFDVNTAHKEALLDAPDGVVVNAVAPDGVIEGIEIAGRRFALGVQWHPEFFLDPGGPHFALFRALVDAAGTRGRRTRWPGDR